MAENMAKFHPTALLALAISFSLLAPGSPASAASGKLTVDVNGVKRTAVIVEQSRLKKVRRPLLIVLHGGNKGSGARVRRNLGLDEFFAEAGAIVVYPDAFEGRWTLNGPRNEKIDDAAFLRAIVAQLENQGLVDARRVYLVGASTGGVMALRMACEAPEQFAGFATVMANMPSDMAATCKPSKPVAMLMINGTADTQVPYAGGNSVNVDDISTVVSTEQGLGIFASAAACTSKGSAYPFPSRNPKPASKAFLERYDGCQAPVELLRIEGGGHTIPGRWSGPGPVAPNHNTDVDAAWLIFDFFKKLSGA